MAAVAAAQAPAAISAVTTAGTAASAVQPLEQLGENTSPSAAQPLEQLGKTTSPTAARKSASPAEITTSGRRSVTPAACHVSAVRRGGAFPRRLSDNYARTNATASSSGAHAAQYGTGAHVAPYGTHPLPPWTSHHSDGHLTSSTYGRPPQHASYAPAQSVPPPSRSVGPTPPPSGPLSDSDWSFSSGPSQALQEQYVPLGKVSEFGLE